MYGWMLALDGGERPVARSRCKGTIAIDDRNHLDARHWRTNFWPGYLFPSFDRGFRHYGSREEDTVGWRVFRFLNHDQNQPDDLTHINDLEDNGQHPLSRCVR